MRRIHVINGLKQRVNEILGADTTSLDGQGNPTITPWSIQAAMLEGMRRIVAALVGDTDFGRPVRGLTLSRAGGGVTVSPGYGMTTGGDIVWLRNSIQIPISGSGVHFLYLLSKTKKLNGAANPAIPEARRTSVIGDIGLYDIVYDDQAAYLETPEETLGVYTQTTDIPLPKDDGTNIFLGTFNTEGGVIANNGVRGLPSYANDAIDVVYASIDNLAVSALTNLVDVNITGRVNLSATASLYPDAVHPGLTLNVPVRNSTDDGTIILQFVNGILIGTYPLIPPS